MAKVSRLLGPLLLVCALPPVAPAASAAEPSAAQDLNTPLLFVENQGQVGSEYRFVVQGAETSALVGTAGIKLVFAPKVDRFSNGRLVDGLRPFEPGLTEPPQEIDLEFVGANAATNLRGEKRSSTVVSYLHGPADSRRTGIPSYESVVYDDLWPGIDLVLSGETGRLKYSFLVAPGADPADVGLAYHGATLAVSDNKLIVSAGAVSFSDEAPYVYQVLDGNKVQVEASYAQAGPDSHGFSVGAYDESSPLVIDPVLPVYAGFIGGADFDQALGVAVDSSGAAYVTGELFSAVTFSSDAYVAKIAPDGRSLVYLTMLGGDSYDGGFDVVVDPGGSAYVVGATFSDERSFPVETGPDLSHNGSYDAFVAKLDPVGSGLVLCGYLGGTDIDFAEGIAVDAGGNMYVEGPANSQDFPVKVGPDLTFNGGYDTFVTKVKARPNKATVRSNLEFSGFIGGGGDDMGNLPGVLTAGHIAIDAQRNVYVSGMTTSLQNTFPTGHGFGAIPGADRTHNGALDAYVAKVRANGRGLLYATYLGGKGFDTAFGMAVGADGSAYFTGDTESTQKTFPVTVGPDLTYNGLTDTYVAKLRPAGTSFAYVGYLGGNDFDQGLGVDLDASGNLYVIGHTYSSEDTFPAVVGPDLSFNGAGDAFVAKVVPNPSARRVERNLEFSGYVGGSDLDGIFWIRVDSSNDMYVVGITASTESTFPAGDGMGDLPTFDGTQGGFFDGFVVKFSQS